MLINKNETIWYEKYRPQQIKDLIITDDIRAKLQHQVDSRQITNMLFCSETPGTGKTSTVNAIVRESSIESLFINASLENGIDTLRGKIKQFASACSFNGDRRLVILDESDNFSENFQAAFRGIIEEFSSNCSFIMTCNYVNKIIPKILQRGAEYSPLHVMHMLVSEIVEGYIPIISKIENRLDEIEETDSYTSGSKIMDEVFDLRSDLLKLRRGLLPMRELIHRFLVSRRVEMTDNDRKYFHDIYDDLVQQTEIIEANRELASDIRENFMTYNSLKSNNIMMTLTVISTIFLPLTFIVGWYGMNFKYMPELEWQYGYFLVVAIMLGIAFGMLWFFKKKGWLDMFK